MEDPFVFGTPTSAPCFTDREDETQRLQQNFLHGINTISATLGQNVFG